MLDLLFILCALIWLPILFYHINYRCFSVVAIWFFVAPVASKVVNYPSHNPIFNTSGPIYTPENQMDEPDDFRTGGHSADDNPIRLNQLLEPTRTLLGTILAVFFLNALVKRKLLDRTEICMIVFSIILLRTDSQIHKALVNQ
jgi:hypothetical protein